MNKKTFFSSFLLAVFVTAGFFSHISRAEAQTDSFQVTQQVRNLTQQNFTWANSVGAGPGDRIEFRITVAWQGSESTQGVTIRETLAEHLSYAGNLRRDGNSFSGNIVTSNLNIGDMSAGQSRTLTFEAVVAPADELPAGTSNLLNTATVFNGNGADSGTATVRASRDGKPTDVSTGPISFWMIGFGIMLFAGAVTGAFLFMRSYLRKQVFESTYETRTDRKLDSMIDQMKNQDKKKG